MARKRRTGPPARPAAPEAVPAGSAAAVVLPTRAAPAAAEARERTAAPALPREVANDGWAAGLLALSLFLAPALGVPGEEMLQDTLKSIIVAFGTLGGALLFLLAQRRRQEPLRWHAVLWLPLLLVAYALGSMGWSHAYLAGVEAIRWFLFAVIVWLGLNTFTRERLPAVAWAFHAGALVASIWAMAQFWGGMELFPQGPNPASTFINRNFFAEFAVCTLPFGMLLLARVRQSSLATLIGLSIALVVTAILMTGTRSALMALWLQLFAVLPLIAWRCRGQLAWTAWPRAQQLLVAAAMVGTVLALGAIPTGNGKIAEEQHGLTPIARAIFRTQSIGPKDNSLGLRMTMWRATTEAIRANPVTGLGAGAWEAKIPLYQAEGSQLETDYYVHNEFLQIVAEYGAVGWIFLLLLAAYLLDAAWRSWRSAGAEADADRPWRATLLCSLLALMLVSNIGFPWRMASTGGLFAACLGALAASDARLGAVRRALAWPLRWSPRIAQGAALATVACLALAAYITDRAAECERKLVTAAKLALGITASGDWNNPAYAPMKQRILELTREGVAINRHYRKITPMIADELARWGDWRDATWIWDSVLGSRPYIVAIIGNVARGYSNLGRNDLALAYLQRAQRIQPNAPTVRSLEVVLLARTGEEQRAMERARQAEAEGHVDMDLINTHLLLASRARDFATVQKLLEERIERWPETRAASHVQLGLLYAREFKDDAKALAFFRQGLAEATPPERPALLQQVPPELRAALAGAAAPQTSANSR